MTQTARPKSSAQILKERFQDIKDEIRQTHCAKLGDFRNFVFSRNDHYNDPNGWQKIENVWYGRASDITLTEIIEEYQEHLHS
jgi:hypothetical protein